MAKTCIVNFGNNKGWYRAGQRRLIDTVNQFAPHIEVCHWAHERDIGCDSHQANPYMFKPAAFRAAQRRGFEIILWVDCSIACVKDPAPVFEQIERDGHLLINSGWNTGQWCSDAALPLLGATRNELWKVPMITAGFLGLDLRKDRSQKFLEEYWQLAVAGAFKGPWTNRDSEASPTEGVLGHRHDQTCASWLVHKLGMGPLHNEKFMVYKQALDHVDKEHVYFVAVGGA